jgi:hypothetical protein
MPPLLLLLLVAGPCMLHCGWLSLPQAWPPGKIARLAVQLSAVVATAAAEPAVIMDEPSSTFNSRDMCS